MPHVTLPREHPYSLFMPLNIVSFFRLAGLAALLLWAQFGLAQLLPDNGPPEEQPLPDPAALKTGWWGYFDPGNPAVAERQGAFFDRLDGGLAKLSPQAREEGERLIAAIRSSLDIYAQLVSTPLPEPQVLPPSSDSYSVDQLVRILDATRVAARQTADDELELNRMRRQVDYESRRRDQAFKDYVAETDSNRRWLAGLRLMQARAQLETSEQRLRLVKSDYENDLSFRKDLEQRLAYARSRLEVPAEESDIKRAAALVDTARQDVVEAQAALTKAELAAAEFDLGTELGKAEQRVEQQRMLRAATTALQKELRFAQLEVQYWIVRFFSDARPALSRLKEKELDWNEIATRVAERRIEWKRDLEERILLLQATPREGLDAKVMRLMDERLKIATGTLAQLTELQESEQDFAFTLTVVEEVASSRVSRTKRWLAVGYEQVLAFWQWFGEVNTATLFEIGETPITGADIVVFFLIILFAVVLSRLVRKGLARVIDPSDTSGRAGLYTFGRLFHYFIILIAIFVALASVGVDFSSLALVAGALGVGIGFGLQSIVNNFVSGLIILFEGTLRVGDYIELDTGVTGTVKAINARSTLINTNDNIDIIVPNAEIASNKLTNWTLGEYILRMRIPFGVEYGSDKELVKQAALEAANNVHYTLKNTKGREPDVWLVEFGDSSLNFLLLVWVNRQGARRPTRTRATYLWELDDVFKKYGITVPFPQRDLHLRGGFDKFPAGGSGPDEGNT